MTQKNLKAEHHILRYVKPSCLRRDDEQNVIGIDFTAFQLRPNDAGLSATWLEYFAGSRDERINASVKAFRASNFKPSKNGAFAIGQVHAIADAARNRSHRIRIVHSPELDNKAHAEVRQLPRDDIELLELFAASVWAELVFNGQIEPGEIPAPDHPAEPF